MKIRKPNDAPVLDTIPNNSDLGEEIYRVKIITPIYGGGVRAGVPDTEMPIRASAIRGQLRYWWRFLAMNRNDKPLKGMALFKEERRIWGGMGDEKELAESGEKDFSSKVFIRTIIAKEQKVETFTYSSQQPQYALFPARGNKRQKIEAKKLISTGVKFDLVISWNTGVSFDNDIKTALRWWASFGGIGARTRRGLGSVEINALDSVTQLECEGYSNCDLRFRKKETTDPKLAWIEAVNTLHDFRQKPGIARKKNSGNTPGRSYWPEPDSIRAITGTSSNKKTILIWNKETDLKDKEYQCNDHTPTHEAMVSFPRAYFGLPIVFKFKDENCGEPKQTMLLPDDSDSERLSSPLILTPYRKPNGRYVSAALKLPLTHLSGLKLKLKKGDTNVSAPRNKTSWKDEWQNWPEKWWHSSKAEHVIPINKNGGTNALDAFMNFFDNGDD